MAGPLFIHFHIPSVEPSEVLKVISYLRKSLLLLSTHTDIVISFCPTSISSTLNILDDPSSWSVSSPFLQYTKKNSFQHYLLLWIMSNIANCWLVSHQNHFNSPGFLFPSATKICKHSSFVAHRTMAQFLSSRSWQSSEE